MGLEHRSPRSWGRCVELFAQARGHYLAGRFEQARAGFLESSELEPLRGQPGVKTCPSKVFAARCEQYLSHPPSDWDGIFTATEK